MIQDSKKLNTLLRKADGEINPNGAVHNELVDQTDLLGDIKNTLQEKKKLTVQVEGLDVLALKGDQGEKGEKGDTGETGDQGEPGEDGKDGINGIDGIDGKNGLNGKDGNTGEKGEKGDKGEDGIDGIDGKDSQPEEIINLLKKEKSLDISHLRNSEQIITAVGKLKNFDSDGFRFNGKKYKFSELMHGAGSGGGTTLTLETNGTPNGDQTLLNLKQGANVTITDDGVGGITIAATGDTGVSMVTGTSPIIVNNIDPANPIVTIQQADGTHNGYLSSTDWTTFNSKQAAGNYITALTGDVTATGGGSVAATLATVNSNVGSFTNASITVNAKGLITAASSGSAPEVPLTFSTGLTRTVNTITANLSTGISGGQTAFGGTGVTDVLSLQGTTGNGTTTAKAVRFLVGNNGATESMTLLNNGFVGIGEPNPLRRLVVRQDGGSATFGGFYNANTTNNNGATWSFRSDTTTTAFVNFASLSGVFLEHTNGIQKGALQLLANQGAGLWVSYDSSGSIGVNASGGFALPRAVWEMQANDATKIVSISKGFTSQSANLYEWQNVSNGVLASISSAGVLTLGLAGTQTGTMNFNGTTSGTVTVQPAAAAGTWTLTLPTTDGNNGEFLQTDGNGVTSWAAASGSSGITRSVNVISTNTAAGATATTDYVYFVSGTTTVTLPTAVGNTNLYTIKRTGTNTVTVATTSAQTIDGAATQTLLTQYESMGFVSDGSNWGIV